MFANRPLLKWSLIAFVVLGVLGVLALTGLLLWAFYHYGRDLPDAAVLARYEPPVATHVHAGDGRFLVRFAREQRSFVPIQSIPKQVQQAFVSAEDKNFYNHPGVDLRGIARASIANIGHVINGRRLEGASTITQQVAGNILLTRDVSFERKIREQILSVRMTRALSKDRVLELYLNEIYLGQRAYGVAAAALAYFNKSLNELSLPEVAYLAAIPKGPNNYHPIRNKQKATDRRNYVIGRMRDDGHITAQEADQAIKTELIADLGNEAEVFNADYFVEDVRKELVDRFGESALYGGGLYVKTSLAPRLQSVAEKAMRDALIGYDRRHGYRGPFTRVKKRIGSDADWAELLQRFVQDFGVPSWQVAAVESVDGETARLVLADGSIGTLTFEDAKWARPWLPKQDVGPAPQTITDVVAAGHVLVVSPGEALGTFKLEQVPDVQGGLVAMDPHTGRVLAMVGGFNFEQSEFNRATQAKRQTGSAFKPFVYTAALERGYTPSSIILDAPLAIDQGGRQGIWRPRNSSRKFYGPSTLRLGLEYSRNLMTVRLAQEIGMDTVTDIGRRFDIGDYAETLAYSLGAGETTLLQLTSAYGELVNGGKNITPSLIDRVQDRYGKTIYRADTRPCNGCNASEWSGQIKPVIEDTREQLVDPRIAYQVVHMLTGVVERGTARRQMQKIGQTTAGKTGTTNGPNDLWFLGFSPDLAVGVYIGFDQPRTLGPREYGNTGATPAFADFMAGALEGMPDIPFRTPPGIRFIEVDFTTGLPGEGDGGLRIMEAFIPGTEPAPDTMATGFGGFANGGGGAGSLATETGGIY
ncbi:MAG: penicillin-binding protein 1A [Pseudomonadota bacterium]